MAWHAKRKRSGGSSPRPFFGSTLPATPTSPDLAFVSYERWPRDRKISSESPWDVVPDLAIEVISPSNVVADIFGKVHEYFEAGVRRVWIVFPVQRQVYVYESATQVQIFGLGDALDGEDILPGFRLALAELFEDGA